MDGNTSTGKLGERIAADYLELVGCRIVDRNFRAGNLELDIVARDKHCLMFVEVKLRRNKCFGEALETIHPWKVRRLREAARRYVSASKEAQSVEEYRFDLVAIDLDENGGVMILKHVRGIA